MNREPTLWHFTCSDHGAPGIGRRGLLRPTSHPFLPTLVPLVWLTDDPMPGRDDVGLTSTILSCDRMECRYRVVTPKGCYRWSSIRRLVDPRTLETLEEFGRSSTWWVSSDVVEVVAA